MRPDELERLLADAALTPAERRFDPGFADRVMQRAGARAAKPGGEHDVLSSTLARQARRMLPAVAAASLAVSAWNWWSVRDRADSALAAVLGLEGVSLSTALSSSSIVDAEELP
ncbi:MAG TPA: hypothetical protein VFS59_01000 [Gemmatimonadaceae bacterium]|nr:hypothetical protein [Gemmatimonadaceae bacterium]